MLIKQSSFTYYEEPTDILIGMLGKKFNMSPEKAGVVLGVSGLGCVGLAQVIKNLGTPATGKYNYSQTYK